MAQEKDSDGNLSRLRNRAEETLGLKPSDRGDISAQSPEKVQQLIHELQVHQIELEIQNEDLRQSQIKLEELKDRYLDLYDFAPVGYVTLNDKGLILEANLTAVRLLDVERPRSTQVFFSRFVCQEFVVAYHLYLKQVFETQSKQTCEIKLARKDGTHFYAHLESIAVQDESGEFNRCRTIVSDITDRKQAEEAVWESEEKFRNLFDNAEVGMFRTRLDGSEILDMNDKFLNIFGLTRAEMRNKPSVIHWADPHEREEMVRRLNTDGRVTDFECKMLNKQGEERVCVTSMGLYSEQGIIEGSITDITDRKRTEALALQSARLKSVADLSSGVAHHFNNLLQIVIGNTSLSLADLESGDLSEIKTNLEQMLRAATLGAEIVKRLQTFANVRADVAERESTVFDITTTARNAAEVSQPLWKSVPEKEGIKIELQLDLGGGCLVKGQENEVFEVLVNLIRNAAEAMPRGGDIEVKAYKEADEVVINVSDTGTGIAEEDIPKVFQPFWSCRGVGIGKGMGLAVTHGLVKRHGGTISVQSAVGRGTTFTISLPLAQEPVRRTEQPAMSPVAVDLTILIIDDNPDIATLLEKICATSGHTIFTAISGEDGLAIFDKEPVDLVISDLGMPGMNGWDVGKAIWSNCREKGITKPPFVLLTGWGGQDLENEKIAESGVDAVVAKPIDSDTLLATVQEIAARFNIRSCDT